MFAWHAVQSNCKYLEGSVWHQYMYIMYNMSTLHGITSTSERYNFHGERIPCTSHLKPTIAVEWISVAVYLITHRILCSTFGDVDGVLDVGGQACVGWFMPIYVEMGRETASAGLCKTLFGWRHWKALVLVEHINIRSMLQKVHWGTLSTIAPGVLNLSAQCRIVPTLA